MQKFKTGKKAVKSLSAVAVALAMGTSVFAGTVFASAAGDDAATASSLTKYYTDYNSMEDAKKAAEDLTRQIVGEGASLLKNSNEALPMSGSEWVSVFGVTSDNLVGASDSAGAFSSGSTSSDETLAAALEHAGFKVNPTLKSFYANDTSSIGAEVTDFPGTVDSSTKLYNDAAFIVLSREGGEGSDASRVTDQTVDEDDDHLALYTDDEGNTYKHYLMLTDEEEALIEYVTSRFDKVIVITNTSNAMELEDLENNDKISVILHIGRPGVGGLAGVTDILTGLSPSGSLVDEWMTDFTTDPTWYNFGSNNQTGDATVGNGAGSNAYRRENGALVGSSQDRVIKGYETAADGVEVTPDGDGLHIGLGGRVTVSDGEHLTLYAEWAEWLPAEDFLYKVNPDGTAELTGYRGEGDGDMFVIPASIEGHKITAVSNSFTTNIPCVSISSPVLVLPDTLLSIQAGAFMHSAFKEIYFFDTLTYVDNNAFGYNIATYHVNAALPPHYQSVNNSTYYADCVDRLITTANKKRVIFFAGCSFAYGINSPMAQAAVGEEYAVCNMGVNGDINGAFQMEIILHYLNEGDILVHTPEVMSSPQLMSSSYFDGRAFIMCEGNYDLLSIPDFSQSSLFFRAYMHFVTIRENEEECSYSDGRSEDFNLYGDYTYPREYDESTERERDVTYSNDAYNYAPDMLTEEGMDRLCAYYDDARAKGATVCISYSPVNSSAQPEVSVMDAGRAFDEKWRAMLAERGYAPISDYIDYLWPGRFFYDSDYHLNDLGAIFRTERLLLDMQNAGVVQLKV